MQEYHEGEHHQHHRLHRRGTVSFRVLPFTQTPCFTPTHTRFLLLADAAILSDPSLLSSLTLLHLMREREQGPRRVREKKSGEMGEGENEKRTRGNVSRNKIDPLSFCDSTLLFSCRCCSAERRMGRTNVGSSGLEEKDGWERAVRWHRRR